MADDGLSDPRLRRRYRVAFAATAMLLVGIAVTLPFSLASVLDEILGLTTGKVLPLLRPRGAAPAGLQGAKPSPDRTPMDRGERRTQMRFASGLARGIHAGERVRRPQG